MPTQAVLRLKWRGTSRLKSRTACDAHASQGRGCQNRIAGCCWLGSRSSAVVVVPAQLSITLSFRVTAPLSATAAAWTWALSRAGFNDLSRRPPILELNVSGQGCTGVTERTLELRKKSRGRRNRNAAVVQHGHGNSSWSDWAIVGHTETMRRPRKPQQTQSCSRSSQKCNS